MRGNERRIQKDLQENRKPLIEKAKNNTRLKKLLEKYGSTMNWSINLLDESNIHKWRFEMVGPANTPYANGIIFGEIEFLIDYPFKLPLFRVISNIHHPSIHPLTARTFWKIEEFYPVADLVHLMLINFFLLLTFDELAVDSADKTDWLSKRSEDKCTVNQTLFDEFVFSPVTYYKYVNRIASTKLGATRSINDPTHEVNWLLWWLKQATSVYNKMDGKRLKLFTKEEEEDEKIQDEDLKKALSSSSFSMTEEGTKGWEKAVDENILELILSFIVLPQRWKIVCKLWKRCIERIETQPQAQLTQLTLLRESCTFIANQRSTFVRCPNVKKQKTQNETVVQ